MMGDAVHLVGRENPEVVPVVLLRFGGWPEHQEDATDIGEAAGLGGDRRREFLVGLVDPLPEYRLVLVFGGSGRGVAKSCSLMRGWWKLRKLRVGLPSINLTRGVVPCWSSGSIYGACLLSVSWRVS